MMEVSQTFLYVMFFLSIIIHIVAGFIVSTFVIPLQVKEANVKNGLQELRRQMLWKGVLSLIVIVVSVIALSGRFFIFNVDILRYIISFMIFIHALGSLGKAILDYKIYHFQYSRENKKLHAMFEEHEVKKALLKRLKKQRGRSTK